jgi:hypothetical protein
MKLAKTFNQDYKGFKAFGLDKETSRTLALARVLELCGAEEPLLFARGVRDENYCWATLDDLADHFEIEWVGVIGLLTRLGLLQGTKHGESKVTPFGMTVSRSAGPLYWNVGIIEVFAEFEADEG